MLSQDRPLGMRWTPGGEKHTLPLLLVNDLLYKPQILEIVPAQIFFVYIQLVIARAKFCGSRAATYLRVGYEGKQSKT